MTPTMPVCTHTHHEFRAHEGTVYGWFDPLGEGDWDFKERCVEAEQKRREARA